jgi:hypothetical protein
VARIRTEAEFQAKVGNMVCILTEVLDKNLDTKCPNPYKRRWWTKELTELKKEQNRLSNAAFKFRHLQDHPSHVEYKAAANRFKEVMYETRDQDWKDWLEAISQQDLYIANKYITSKPTNFSNTCIPTLHTTTNRLAGLAESNAVKAEALVQSFFPPPPDASSIPPGQIYPEALQGPRFFSRSRIRRVICKISPYKAPGPDKIPNIVLKECIKVLIDRLFFIFRAVFELKVYHPKWLESTTVVLHKWGKAAYDVAKSYCPIGLINTILKVLAMLCSRHITYLAERHDMLPSSQFGGQPGQNTTDAMLLVVHKIKSTWR